MTRTEEFEPSIPLVMNANDFRKFLVWLSWLLGSAFLVGDRPAPYFLDISLVGECFAPLLGLSLGDL